MKAHEDKAEENLVNKVMQDTVIESPSLHFTNRVHDP